MTRRSHRVWAPHLLAAVVLITANLFPLVWMALSSLKSRTELYRFPPTFVPSGTIEHYVLLFSNTEFSRYILNSTLVAGIASSVAIVVAAMAAYSLARFRFWGFGVVKRTVFFAYMVPPILIIMPLYRILIGARLIDSLVGLSVVNVAYSLPFSLWLLVAYFRTLPMELEEAALIDGCSRPKAIWKVALPLSIPGLVAAFIFAFNRTWNDFLFGLILISTETKKTLPLGLALWVKEDSLFSWGMLLAAGVITTVPILFFFGFLQRNLVTGIAAGGTKG